MDKYAARRFGAICIGAIAATAIGFAAVKDSCDEYQETMEAWNAVHAEYSTEYSNRPVTTSFAYTRCISTSTTTTEVDVTEDTECLDVVEAETYATTYVTDSSVSVVTDTPETSSTEITESFETSYTEYVDYSTTYTGAGVSLTDYEIGLLSTLVYLEGGTESYECQKAIASTVINRMIVYGEPLSEVIYKPGQYSVADMLSYSTYTDSTYNAVIDVLNYGTTLPVYVNFFRAGYYHSWGDQVAYCYMGNTYFSYSQATANQYC